MEDNGILLKIIDVSKKFPGVQALDKINLKVRCGEVHAIVGENGAGKSTLMNILSGVIGRDQGEIEFKGQKFAFLPDPRYSQQMGISTVHQELALASNLSIMDNVFLWDIPQTRAGIVDNKTLCRRTKELLNSLGINLNPETLVRKLSVSERQIVEIARALSMNASLIIMDEPNSALSPSETKFLFDIIQKLRSRGVTILFISHRLDEIFEIADRITVLRDGKLIDTKNKEETTVENVVSMMVGRELKKELYKRTIAKGRDIDDCHPVLQVRNLSNGKRFKNISFDLYRHEILGVAGLVGAGRTEMAEALFGIYPPDQGEVLINGNRIEIHNPSDAVQNGMGFVPEDRKLAGLFLKMSVADNINMTSLKKVSHLGMINSSKEQTQAQTMVKEMDIRLHSTRQQINSLSGGNQQKAIIARWLTVNPSILILDEPTRGIDVGAKAQIYELINRLAEKGMAIILISSELEEILALSDRIMVMRRGRISAEFNRLEANSDNIMLNAA